MAQQFVFYPGAPWQVSPAMLTEMIRKVQIIKHANNQMSSLCVLFVNVGDLQCLV